MRNIPKIGRDTFCQESILPDRCRGTLPENPDNVGQVISTIHSEIIQRYARVVPELVQNVWTLLKKAFTDMYIQNPMYSSSLTYQPSLTYQSILPEAARCCPYLATLPYPYLPTSLSTIQLGKEQKRKFGRKNVRASQLKNSQESDNSLKGNQIRHTLV